MKIKPMRNNKGDNNYMKLKKKFGKKQMMLLGTIIVSIFLLAGCTNNNNAGEDNEGTGGTGDDGGSDGTTANIDVNMLGNWTWTSGTNNGEPITHISSGWVHFKNDGTFNSVYDYGYTLVIYEGTWQAQNGDLYWGTNGNEISDWYSTDSYQASGNELIITSDSSEMIYNLL